MTRLIAAGNAEAFGCFFDRYAPIVEREIARCLKSDEATRLDVLQETMLRFIRAGRTFEDEQHLTAWLMRCTRCCAYDTLRAELRRRRRSEQFQGRDINMANDNRAEEDQRRLRWLRDEITRLNRADHELLTMRHRFGWTLQQIANALGLTTGAVDGRLRRVLGRIQLSAQEYADESSQSD